MSNTTKCINNIYTIFKLVHRILNGIWSLIEMQNHSLCWGPLQLALSVEFLFEILCVGAHPQLAHYCNDFSSASLLGPHPIIEKCLLHGHFCLVNICLYNIVEPKTWLRFRLLIQLLLLF